MLPAIPIPWQHSCRLTRAVWCALALHVGAGSDAAVMAQVPDTAQSSGSRQSIHLAVEVELDPLPKTVFGLTNVFVASGGHFFSTSFARPSLVHVWAASGGYQGTVSVSEIDLILVRGLVPVEDSLFVFDVGARAVRVTSLREPWRLYREAALSGNIYDLFGAYLTPQGWLVNGLALTPESIGYPLHLLDRASFQAVRSFGSDAPRFRLGDSPADLYRPIAVDTKNPLDVWVADDGRRLVEHWSTQRGTTEFPSLSLEAACGQRPAFARVLDIFMDSTGVLWLSTTDNYPGNQDVLICAYDPKRARYLMSDAVPGEYAGFLDDGRLYSIRSADDGYAVVVWKPTLTK
jgi:hypothetical protein